MRPVAPDATAAAFSREDWLTAALEATREELAAKKGVKAVLRVLARDTASKVCS